MNTKFTTTCKIVRSCIYVKKNHSVFLSLTNYFYSVVLKKQVVQFFQSARNRIKHVLLSTNIYNMNSSKTKVISKIAYFETFRKQLSLNTYIIHTC